MGGPGSDQAYSNGFKISYLFSQDEGKKSLQTLAETFAQNFLFSSTKSSSNFALSLGQQIYTPNDTRSELLQVNDRPYASWLYLGLATGIQHLDFADFFDMSLGVVDPSAKGEEVQNNFHDVIRTGRAQGWKNTLSDELTLQGNFQRRLKIKLEDDFDLIHYYGVGLGNVLTGAHFGGLIRYGKNLPDDLGPSRTSSNEGGLSVLRSFDKNKIQFISLVASEQLQFYIRSFWMEIPSVKALGSISFP